MIDSENTIPPTPEYIVASDPRDAFVPPDPPIPPPRGDWYSENYIRWSPDGSQILFDVSEDILEGPVNLYSVTVDSSRLKKIVSANSNIPARAVPISMIYYDVSHDGSRIVFSSCMPYGCSETEGKCSCNYDIALANIDGSKTRKLKEDSHFENFPVWSPDGSRVAYFSSDEYGWRGQLAIYTLSTGESSEIDLPSGDFVFPHPPVWSPDGQRLAFVAYERMEGNSIPVVYTVGSDGSDLTRISNAASGPAWSPDGGRIAVAVPRGPDKAALYSFASDGSRPILISPTLPDPWENPAKPWMGNLSWSPDGSAILFEGFAHAVNVHYPTILFDGVASIVDYMEDMNLPSLSRLPQEAVTDRLVNLLAFSHMFATWSPDGSKIAIQVQSFGIHGLPRLFVFLMDRDGSNLRLLVVGFEDESGFEIRPLQ